MDSYTRKKQRETIKNVAYKASGVVISYYFPTLIPVITLSVAIWGLYENYYDMY